MDRQTTDFKQSSFSIVQSVNAVQWILITTDEVAYPKHLETFVTNEHFYLNKLSVNVVLGGEGGVGKRLPVRHRTGEVKWGLRSCFAAVPQRSFNFYTATYTFT